MSFDLRVYTQTRPALESPKEAGVEVVQHHDGHDAESAELIRELASGQRQLCVADGPYEVVEEEDDLPSEVLSVLISVEWEVQISCPSDLTDGDVRRVNTFARSIAKAGNGLVFDPQAGRIAWPRSRRNLRKPPARRESSERYLSLQWAFAEHLSDAHGMTLIELLTQHLPEALPRRFGTFEPLQGRLDRDGNAAFAELFNGPHRVTWKGSRPHEWGFADSSSAWGSALSVEEREALTPELGGQKAVKPSSLKLQFEAAVATEPAWSRAVRNLFCAVGEHLEPFYGIALIAQQTDKPFDEVPDQFLSGKWWLGIPSFPTWLTWVGHPYLDLMPSSAPASTKGESGAFVAHSEGPTDQRTQRETMIGWDQNLIRRGGQLDEANAARAIPALRRY